MKKLIALEISLLVVALRGWGGEIELPTIQPPQTTVIKEVRAREEKRHPVPGVVRRAPLPASRFEKYVASSFILSDSPPRQFGYDVFQFQPSSFAPVADLPIGPDYVVGPGDSFLVRIWGKMNLEFDSTVERDGRLILRGIGTVRAAGLSFERLEKAIKSELDKHYRDYELSVTIKSLRTITVFVIGHVRTPGSYTLGGTSTAITALFAAGGPTKTGSMRAVRVLRRDTVVGELDLYEFFLSGSRAGDTRLQSGDAVLVPPAGALVALDGAAKCPAIYELQTARVALGELLEFAGGLDFDADKARVQLERDGELTDVDLRSPGAEGTNVRGGDIVRIYRRSAVLRNVVYVRGNVAEPAMYAFRDGVRVRDLLSPRAFVRAGFWANRRRFASAAGGGAPGQEAGHVDLDPAETNLPEPYWEHALVKRVEYPSLEESYISFNLGKAVIKGDEKENVELRPQDTVLIFSRSDFVPAATVSVSGAINKPGTYVLRPGMGLRDLVSIAGGVARDAAEIVQLTHFGLAGARHSTLKLDEILSGSAAGLSPGDSIFLPRRRELKPWGTATVGGEVRFPGSYVISPGERLSDVLERAGGFTAHAYLRGSVLLRESVRKFQQEQLEEAITSFEAQAESYVAAEMHKLPDDRAKMWAAERRGRLNALLGRLKAARARGRVVVRLKPPGSLRGTPGDVFVEPGDSLHVPTKPSTVTVFGAVNRPSAVVFEDSLSVQDYVTRCGGLTDDADVSGMYFVGLDGSAVSADAGRLGGFQWSRGAHRWVRRGILGQKPGPGDIIVVPERIEARIYPGRLAMDVTQVLYQIALATSLVVTVF